MSLMSSATSCAWTSLLTTSMFGHARDERDRHEVLHGIVGKVLVEARVDRVRADGAAHDRVAVGRGLGDLGGTEPAARARLVLDDHGLAERDAQLLGDGAAHDVRAAACGERNDVADRLRRPRLRRRLRMQLHVCMPRQHGDRHGHRDTCERMHWCCPPVNCSRFERRPIIRMRGQAYSNFWPLRTTPGDGDPMKLAAATRIAGTALVTCPGRDGGDRAIAAAPRQACAFGTGRRRRQARLFRHRQGDDERGPGRAKLGHARARARGHGRRHRRQRAHPDHRLSHRRSGRRQRRRQPGALLRGAGRRLRSRDGLRPLAHHRSARRCAGRARRLRQGFAARPRHDRFLGATTSLSRTS